MKNVKFGLLTVILITACIFGVAKAQEVNFSEEAIADYNSVITVNTDNSIDVRETIIYNSGPQERHGIYRDIYTFSSQKKKMSIDSVIVTDENNSPYQFQVSNNGENVRIKIGDPDQTFSGQKIYIIEYRATKAIAQFKDFDEIYWNVTGNDWAMPILEAQASVVLPYSTQAVQKSCYYGKKGSTEQCEVSNNGTDSVYTFNTPSNLNPYGGLTVAVGFPKGIVIPYSSSDSASDFWSMYWRWIVSSLLPILTLIFSLRYWHKKGRDPKGTGVIVAQYDVSDNLTPMEVGGIVNEKVDVKYISAEIIYLATKGYLKIEQLEEKFIGFIKTTDYELTKLKEPVDLANDFDKNLLDGLFSNRSVYGDLLKANVLKKLPKVLSSILKKTSEDTDELIKAKNLNKVKLSDLKNEFYKDIPDIVGAVLDSLLNKNYYKNLGKMKSSAGGRIFVILFMSVWASGFFGILIGGFLMGGKPVSIMVGIFSSVIIYGIISHFNPAKTEKGVLAKEHILGLKNYLQIAEKDRLLFHNAPTKRPEIFEKLLPFAMVLGVADIWAKEFEGIYTTPPSWYSGTGNTAFSAIAFSHSMSNFSSFASSSLNSSPGGSGSGGGGSSGGGGGGGGGGGW